MGTHETPTRHSRLRSSPVITSLLDELKTPVPRVRTPLRYRVGLIPVACAMVLLPIVYVALIALVAALVEFARPEYRRRIGEAARRAAEATFGFGAMIDAYQRVLGDAAVSAARKIG